MAPHIEVHISDSEFPDTVQEEAVLAPAGIRLVRHDCKSPQEIIAQCQDADALLVWKLPITREVMEGLPRLKAIARYGVGYDNFDLEAANDLGIAACNVPAYCIEEVATHALTLMLALNRGLYPLRAAIAGGRWGFSAVDVSILSLSNVTLGVVGLGRIGSRVARYARALGMTVIANDPYIPPGDVPLVSFDELLDRADIVTLHVPLTDETRHLIDARALDRMKPTAYLINTARGAVVDTAALDHALRAGRIAGAGLDVLPAEPPDPRDPLLAAPNLILTPHVAWYALGAPERMRRGAAGALTALFRGERPEGLVNPEALGRGRWGNMAGKSSLIHDWVVSRSSVVRDGDIG